MRKLTPRRLSTLVALSLCSFTLLFTNSGCKSDEQNERTLMHLQHGRAKGHLVLTSDGSLEGGMYNAFRFGPAKSSLSFDGDVDYAPASNGDIPLKTK